MSDFLTPSNLKALNLGQPPYYLFFFFFLQTRQRYMTEVLEQININRDYYGSTRTNTTDTH